MKISKNWFFSLVYKAWWIVPIVVIGMHIPFLQADPDVRLSHSRDALSDEGLNSSQIRNFIHYGKINAWECDNLIKTPLFNLMIWPPMALFGTYREVPRISVLLFVFLLLSILFANKPYRRFWAVMVPMVFLQFHMFQYSHFSMAEMPAIACTIAAIAAWCRHAAPQPGSHRLRWLALSIMFSSMAWYMKIQFIYLLPLIPVSTIILWFTHRSHRKNFSRFVISSFFLFGIVALFVLLYLAVWYYPLRQAWTYIMQNQTAARFPIWKYQGEVFDYNFALYFMNERVMPIFGLFIISIPAALGLLFHRTKSVFPLLLIPATCWILLETHKVLIHHVPGRYLVSTFAAMGFFACITWVEMARRFLPALTDWFTLSRFRRGWGIIAFVLISGTIAYHLFSYADMYQKRRYDMHRMNRYLQNLSLGKITAVGAWAPSITWGTQIKAVPVWKDFLNDRNILSQHQPRIIFSEPEEQESNQAFSNDGIRISAIADSLQQTMPGNKWTVMLYWINPDTLSVYAK